MAPNSEAQCAIYLQNTRIRITAPIHKIWCSDVPQSLLVCCKCNPLFLYLLSHSCLLFGSPVCYWPFSGSLASLVGDLRPLPNLPHDTEAIKTSNFSLPRTICIPPPTRGARTPGDWKLAQKGHSVNICGMQEWMDTWNLCMIEFQLWWETGERALFNADSDQNSSDCPMWVEGRYWKCLTQTAVHLETPAGAKHHLFACGY